MNQYNQNPSGYQSGYNQSYPNFNNLNGPSQYGNGASNIYPNLNSGFPQQGNFGGYGNYGGFGSQQMGFQSAAGQSGLFDGPSSNSSFNSMGNPATQYPNNSYSNNFNQGSFDQYPPSNQYQQNNQYPPSNQYQQSNQYPSNNQYPPSNQYQPSNQYPPNNSFNQAPTPVPNAFNNNQASFDTSSVPTNPTLRSHAPFDPNSDATKLYKAMKGLGTDETTLIDILCKRTSHQRQQIALSFKGQYGKDLTKNLESETSGNFKMLLKALMMTSIQLEAHDLKHSIDGWGTDELSLIDIICTKNNRQMIELKNTYRMMYNRNLETEVKDDVSGYFKRFLVSLMAANRAETPADPQRAQQIARELYTAGVGQLGTNETVFNRVFATESFAQLRAIFDAYYQQTGHQIEQAIKREMSTSVERAFLTVAQYTRNPATYYAQRLNESMRGSGTRDRTLVRWMILRSELDLATVKMEFNKLYHSSLEAWIKSDTSGDYKRSLLCLAGDPNWR